SVQQLVINMRKNKGEKQYKGIFPRTEEELLYARQQLAKYLRTVWDDEVFAMEVELAVSKENYEIRMQAGFLGKMLSLGRE
ncbi:unnamed protein product, partial [marine sediment metagenome]